MTTSYNYRFTFERGGAVEAVELDAPNLEAATSTTAYRQHISDGWRLVGQFRSMPIRSDHHLRAVPVTLCSGC